MKPFVNGALLGLAIVSGACGSRTVSDDAWAVQLSEVQGYAQIEDLTVDEANNTYLAGYVTFAEPTKSLADIFVAKVDSAGKPTWLRSSGSPCGSDFGRAIALNADGKLFLAGRIALSSCGEKAPSLGGTSLNGENDSVLLSQISASGDFEQVSFASQAVNDHSGGLDLAIAEDDSIVVLGDYIGSPAIGETLPSARVSEASFIARASRDGALQSSQRLQLPGGPYCSVAASRIASGAEGTVFVTGLYRKGIPLGTNGACGTLPANPNGTSETFVASLTDSGSTRWVAAPATTNMVVFPHALVVDGQGRSYITGEFSRTSTFSNSASIKFGQHQLQPPTADRSMFIASISAGGEFRWAIGVDSAVGWGLALSPSGDLLVSGAFYGKDTFGSLRLDTAGGADAFVARVRHDGELLAAVSGGGREADHAHAIAVSRSGHIYVAGTFKGSARFATAELEGHGTNNFFLWKLAPDSL